ncbi:bestrophin family ion channel [Rhodoblastus sp. 17X3]|uniref:bestrophin family protein n=1 Tax=Rhodoblastus sp. 17X3 TaxID=3047026 RepID=UPI0024B7E110|nr:bestrophin family ion channel [Rhodoblastus sp. 17X3]MDI9848592.1 bestrophin family ion channel [Rhodoblastus sp. 17X3]
MIVQKQLNIPAMLFAFRGTVVPLILPHILLVATVALAITAVAELRPGLLPEISLAPFSLLGLVLSIFLGFRNNVCYDRWWEGRKQWGQAIGHARALAREIPAFLPDESTRRSRALRRVAGFAACLAAQLRERDEVAALAPWLPEPEAAALPGLRNRPAAALAGLTRDLAAARREGAIGEIMLQMLEAHVEGLSAVQSACERINSTPTPFSYSLLLHRTSWIFCLLVPFGLVGALGWLTPFFSMLLAYAFFGLDALGDELELPFGLAANHLALDSFVRAIEIEIMQAIGEAPPEPLPPANGRLT